MALPAFSPLALKSIFPTAAYHLSYLKSQIGLSHSPAQKYLTVSIAYR